MIWHSGRRARWRCSGCQAVLVQDGRRYGVGWLALALVMVGFPFLLESTDQSLEVVLLEGFLVLAIFYAPLLWLHSCKVEGTPQQPQSSQADKPSEE